MKFRTRLRFMNLPIPGAAEDLAAGGAPGGAAAAASAGGEKPWYASDPTWEEAAKDAEFKGWVEKGGSKGAVALLKTQRELEGKLGNSLTPWKQGEDPTKWAGWQKLGALPDVEAYGKAIKRADMPQGMEWDKEAEKQALELAVKTGAPLHMVQAFLDHQVATRISDAAKLKDLQTAEADNLNKLYAEWGADKDAKLALAQRVFRGAGMDGELATQIEGFIGGARMMKLFATLGEGLKEGQFVDGGQPANATTKEGALAKIAELDAKYLKDGLSKEERAERTRLFAIAYPS